MTLNISSVCGCAGIVYIIQCSPEPYSHWNINMRNMCLGVRYLGILEAYVFYDAQLTNAFVPAKPEKTTERGPSSGHLLFPHVTKTKILQFVNDQHNDNHNQTVGMRIYLLLLLLFSHQNISAFYGAPKTQHTLATYDILKWLFHFCDTLLSVFFAQRLGLIIEHFRWYLKLTPTCISIIDLILHKKLCQQNVRIKNMCMKGHTIPDSSAVNPFLKYYYPIYYFIDLKHLRVR